MSISNRPERFLLRNAKGPRVKFLIPLIVLIMVVLLLALVASGTVQKPQELIGVFGFGAVMVAFLLLLSWTSALNRQGEARAIQQLFDGEIWAHWQFKRGELAPLYRHQGESAPFQLWFGPQGIYHELEGYTPLRLLVTTTYVENHKPVGRSWVSAHMGREGGQVSKEFMAAMANGTIGDENTPKIAFQFKNYRRWWRKGVTVYFPVAKGHEQEAKMLVQRYQMER